MDRDGFEALARTVYPIATTILFDPSFPVYLVFARESAFLLRIHVSPLLPPRLIRKSDDSESPRYVPLFTGYKYVLMTNLSIYGPQVSHYIRRVHCVAIGKGVLQARMGLFDAHGTI